MFWVNCTFKRRQVTLSIVRLFSSFGACTATNGPVVHDYLKRAWRIMTSRCLRNADSAKISLFRLTDGSVCLILDQSNSCKASKEEDDQWKDNALKRKRIAGEAYKSRSGKYANPRSTGPACNCRMRCFSKLSDDDRGKLLSHYNEMDTYDAQWVYLSSLIQISDPSE